jgi:hypothetical protein
MKPEISYDRFMKMIGHLVEQQHMFQGLSNDSIEFIITCPEEAIPIMMDSIENRFAHANKNVRLAPENRDKFTLEKFKSVNELIKAIESKGWTISLEALFMLKHKLFTLSKKATRVNVVRPRGGALGFVAGVHMPLVAPRAEQFKLKPVAAEVAVQLCLHAKLDNHRSAFAVMEPIPGPKGKPMVFSLRRNDHYLLLEAVEADSSCRHGDLEYILLDQ